MPNSSSVSLNRAAYNSMDTSQHMSMTIPSMWLLTGILATSCLTLTLLTEDWLTWETFAVTFTGNISHYQGFSVWTSSNRMPRMLKTVYNSTNHGVLSRPLDIPSTIKPYQAVFQYDGSKADFIFRSGRYIAPVTCCFVYVEWRGTTTRWWSLE